MVTAKNDFVEIEFTGKIIDSDEIFDTNIESEAKKAGNMNSKKIKPFILSVGHKMLPSGFDNDLIGKDVGKSYTLNLEAEDAFGKRNPQMVRMVPTKMFHEQKINPVKGMQISLDGQLTKILSSDKGRTLVDFNNPLAGKNVTYDYKILRTISDDKEKVNALQDFLFRRQFEFDIKDKTVTFKIEKQFEPFVKMFTPKFEEILSMKIEVEVVEAKPVKKD